MTAELNQAELNQEALTDANIHPGVTRRQVIGNSIKSALAVATSPVFVDRAIKSASIAGAGAIGYGTRIAHGAIDAERDRYQPGYLVRSYFAPYKTEYEPPFQQSRPIVALSDKDFELVRPKTAQEFLNRVTGDLIRIRLLIEERQHDPVVNPDLGDLVWYQQIGKFDFMQPPTLLQYLTILQKDIQDRRVHLGKNAASSIANGATEYYLDDSGKPLIEFSEVNLGEKNMYEERYPDLVRPGQLERISNLNLCLLVAYEYGRRFTDIGILATLINKGYFKENPATNALQVYQVVEGYKRSAFEHGFRHSAVQNYLQLSLHRSLAALSGNPNGRVIGLERNENWPIYQHYIASLNGDQKALRILGQELSTQAGY